jgi:hypothetical protein
MAAAAVMGVESFGRALLMGLLNATFSDRLRELSAC